MKNILIIWKHIVKLEIYEEISIFEKIVKYIGTREKKKRRRIKLIYRRLVDIFKNG
jgi:hypothetical protein